MIGDSMAGIRIDPRYLSRVTGRSVVGLFTPGTPVAYWYLQLKNLVVHNGLTNMRGAIMFFRDDHARHQPAAAVRARPHESPEFFVLWAGVFAFAVQIYADFSAEPMVPWPRVATQAALAGLMMAAILTLRSQTTMDFIYFAF